MRVANTDSKLRRSWTRLSLREPRKCSELLSLLRLRYEVYRKSRLVDFCPENELEIDVDPHDTNALHLGLFDMDDRTSDPVGYIRIVGYNSAPSIELIHELAHQEPVIAKAINSSKITALPLIGYTAEGKTVQRLYSKYLARGNRVIEPGRLSLVHGGRSLKRASFVIKSVFAIASTGDYRCDVAFLTCSTTHRRFYRSLGFRRIPGTTDEFWTKDRVHGSALEGTPFSIPNAFACEVGELADQFYTTGATLWIEDHIHSRSRTQTSTHAATATPIAA